MATGDNITFLGFPDALPKGGVSWQSDTIKAALITGSVNHVSNVNWSDLSGQEVSGTNYAQQTLGTKTVTKDGTAKVVELGAASAVFAGLGADVGTPSYVIVYKDTGTATTSTLICSIESNVAANGEDYRVNFVGGVVVRMGDPNVP